jgi:hypothetical protein
VCYKVQRHGEAFQNQFYCLESSQQKQLAKTKSMAHLDPITKRKLIAYVRKEHQINVQAKRIFLLGFSDLSAVEKITQDRIKTLQKHEGYKVYSQLEIWK